MSHWRTVLIFCIHFFCITGAATLTAQAAEPGKEPDMKETIARIDALIKREIELGNATGISIALVHDQQIIHTQAYGLADRAKKTPATTDTIYRAGSISKLFTAVSAMQLAEQGRFDIDKPIGDYIPGFGITNPFEGAKPMTARQLMCHRSGIIRESPVGSYFDPTEPGIEATVKSIAPCVLPIPPESKTKYSNVGPTIVGHAVEKISGLDFETYQRKHLFGPLKMQSSTFTMSAAYRPRLSNSYMPVADGHGGFREMESPQFELGTLPAGNLYTTAPDLARFAMCLFAEGKAGDTQVIKPQTLREIFTPQFTTGETGFGLGFSVGKFGKHKIVSHMGAVYGFTSAFTAIPEHKLAVIVLNNDDINIGPVRKINNTALSLLLKAYLNEDPPAPAKPIVMSRDDMARFTGEYESESYWATIEFKGDALQANISGQRNSLWPVGEMKFEAYGRQLYDQFFEFQRDEAGAVTGFNVMGQKFTRLDPRSIKPIPQAWRDFLGSYGPDFIPLIITQRHGRLYAMTENMYDYRMTPVTATIFNMCPGMYSDEELVIHRDAAGKVYGITLANMPLMRR